MANVKTAERKKFLKRPERIRQPPAPSLRFSPYAWAKLLFLRDVGETEVGGFGITRADDLLLVEDVQLVPQVCTWASVEFEDAAVADYFDRQADDGISPEACGRIWIHTHPGNSAAPSSTDEATFARVFGRNEWAVMFILAQNGDTYARLRFSAGPGGSLELPISVDYSQPFAATEHGEWLAEYRACVKPDDLPAVSEPRPREQRQWREEQAWFRDFEQAENDQERADRAAIAEGRDRDLWQAKLDQYERDLNGEFY